MTLEMKEDPTWVEGATSLGIRTAKKQYERL